MVQQFSISPARFNGPDAALRDEIQKHTENVVETTRIMSALRRFGTDASIEGFDLIPSASRGFRGATGTSWTVRAMRKRPEVIVEAAPI